MNPNWTGRSARTLSECRFWDADPIERSKSRDYGAAWWISICIVSLVGALAIIHMAAP